MFLTILVAVAMFYFNFGMSPVLDSWLFFVQVSIHKCRNLFIVKPPGRLGMASDLLHVTSTVHVDGEANDMNRFSFLNKQHPGVFSSFYTIIEIGYFKTFVHNSDFHANSNRQETSLLPNDETLTCNRYFEVTHFYIWCRPTLSSL